MWLLPATLTTGACVLAAITITLDRKGIVVPDNAWFMLASGAEGARGVLSTIAGGIITVTGVVFSITIVVLQLASSQYSPRILRSFTEDRINQLVLGVFIATFTYSLLVLRTVRSSFDDYDRFVPSLSVNIAVLLALLSIGLLIYFVNHIATAIQAEAIIERVTRDAIDVVERLFPEEMGDDATDGVDQGEILKGDIETAVTAERGGYLQSVDDSAIMKLAEEHGRYALRLR